MKFLNKRIEIGSLILPLLMVVVVLVGFVGAALSWSVPNPPSAANFTQLTPAMVTVHPDGSITVIQQSQTQPPVPLNPQDQQTSPKQPAAPQPLPPIAPVTPPCNYCAPTSGRVCPMYRIFPCTPCVANHQTESICETE